ncbi:MAG: M1 family metallopeptidase [Taibaiella sp.]|nr:M1 family metallopeptidase [Taibaiella sp.]
MTLKKKRIKGAATWTFDRISDADTLVLDTDELNIDSVISDNGKKTEFLVMPAVPMQGAALKIPISPGSRSATIYYSTQYNEADTFAALQWLEPSQTFGKKQPYLFTKSEPTMSRCWIPCQDLPSVKITYTADITVPKGLMALMSAANPQEKNPEGRYHFEMKQPVPVYLVAMAVGDIEFKAIDEQTGVYTEPSMLDKCQSELQELPAMMQSAQKLIGPYQWERYDVLVLPLGFPIGGMENPRLTFSTPTIIAGDRSLVALIAHELAHSWSGNQVTNATWDDLWINEGFTVYFERRIMEDIRGKEYADMLWTIGKQDLDYSIQKLGAKSGMTKLKLNLEHMSPLESFSDVAYEKGAYFLWSVEQTVGRPAFDSFLRYYFDKYAFKSVSTEKFIEELEDQLLSKNKKWGEQVNYIEWIFNPGIPANCPQPGNVRFGAVDQQRAAFEASKNVADLNTGEWSTHEWLHFLRNLSSQVTAVDMRALDQEFRITGTGNSEIACAWYQQAIRKNYTQAYGALEKFLINTGREKFLEPLYEELVQNRATQGLAAKIFEKAKNNYHPIVRQNMYLIVQHI